MADATLAGWAFKQGSKVKNWKKRFFVLRGRELAYYASQPPARGDGDEKGRVVVVGAELDAPNAMLFVTCERKTQLLKLKPVAPEDAPRWLAALQRAAGTVPGAITSPVGSARPQVVLKRDSSVNAANLFGTDLHDDQSDAGDDRAAQQQPAESVAAYYKAAQPLPAKQPATEARANAFGESKIALFDDNQTEYDDHDDHGSFDFGDDDDSELSRRRVGALAQGNHIGVAREGWLTVGEPQDPRSWKKRYAVLAGPTLTYFASKGSGEAIASVWVKRVSLSSTRANALDLELDSGRTLGVAADSREELMLWERAVAKVLGTSVLLRAASSKDDIDQQIELDFGDPNAVAMGGRPSSYTGVFHEGWLLLKNGFGKNEWQKRYFVLNGATLQERESPTAKTLSESYVVHMTVQNDSSAAEFELELMSGRTLRLQAENTVDAEAWIHALAELVGTPAVKSTTPAQAQSSRADSMQLPAPVIRPLANLPPQKVKKTGWLMKEGGLIKSWKRRYFILDGDALHYFDKVDGGLLGGGIVFRVVHNFVTANSLDVHFVNGRILRISAETRADIDTWFEALRVAADAAVYKALPSPTHKQGAQDSSTSDFQRGWLLKRGQMMKTWKRRYFVIQRNRLTYYDTMGGELLGSGTVFDVTGGNQRPLSLDVRFQNGRLLHVAAADDEDYKQWHDALKSASNISESVLSHSSLSQEELPFAKDFDYDIQDEGAERDTDDMFADFDANEEEGDELSTGYGMWEAAMNNKPDLSRQSSWDSDLSDVEDLTDSLRPRANSETPSIPDEQQRACSGWLRKQGEVVKNWKRRYFTLHGSTLKYFKSDSGSFLRSYEVTQVEETPSTKFGFAIVMKGGRRLIVAAESNEDYEKWLLALWGVVADQRASLAGQGGGDDSRYSAVGVISVKSVPTSPVGSGPSKPATTTTTVTSHSGWLEKEGQRFKTWKRRYFTVKNGALMYFNDVGGEMQGHSTVHGVIVDKAKPNTLRILLAKDRVLRVTAATADEMTEWFQVLSATKKPQSKSPRGSTPGSDIEDDFSDYASSVGSAADRRSLGSAPSSPANKQPPGRSRFDESDYLKNDTITNESFLRIRGTGDDLSLTTGSFYKPRSFKGDLAFAPTLATPTEATATEEENTLIRVDSEDDLEYLKGSNVDHERLERLRKKKEDEVLVMPQKCAACCIVM